MKQTLGIYIHIPYCVRKCNYCDFLSLPLGETEDCNGREAYVKQLLQEIQKPWKIPENPVTVDTVYIGGGTPSVLSISQISSIISQLRKQWKVDPQAEITMECNPGTVDRQGLMQYREMGINRLSMGIQSAVEHELQALGRIHTFSQAKQAVEWAKEAGFTNISVDLMSAIPGQTLESYEFSLHQILNLEPQHISSYSLIIEEGTPFYEKYWQKPPVDEETDRRMYEMTGEILEANGYRRYEISNYAKPGYESRHNTKYWTGKDYLGIGLGASSKIGRFRIQNERELSRYLQNIQEHKRVSYIEETLTKEEEEKEYFILGLRCTRGVSLKQFVQCFGREALAGYEETIRRICELGLAKRQGEMLALTKKGIDVSNLIFEMFL
ncbi:MAG: radical SAM family heme chaperone HemW [Eubacterium sp.]|nr:radical SAM family heme chaperone HemW [Eubacterium sp.]